MHWTLKYKNTEKTLSQWGLSQLKRHRINQGTDKVSFTHNGASLEHYSLFDPETPIQIYKDHLPWFYGIVTKTPGFATATREDHLYELSGPWWHLENLVYQQTWNESIPINETEDTLRKINTGRVILGQDTQGNSINNGAQITQILQYAIHQEAPLLIGEIEIDVIFPYDETKDITCAEAIKRLLRWSPDAVVWFDYSTQPSPTLHIKRRATIPEANLYLNENNCIKSLNITPRHDLQSPAVVIKYEKIHNTNGQSWMSTEVDAYPPSTTGREFKALVLTVELDGAHSQKIKQDIKTAPIIPESPEWWQKHLPALPPLPPSKIIIKEAKRNGKLPAELISGNISAWMGNDVEEDIIRAKLSYETETEQVIDREVAIRLTTTDASTRVYEKLLSNEYPEPTPVGLAKKLYEAVSALQFDGEVVLENQEVNTATLMGCVLNIFHGNPLWATMRANIQSVKENIDYGRTTITFGPPKHLGPDDLIELLRANRKRQATRNAVRRITGKPSKSTTLEQPTHSRIENTHNGPANFGKLVFVNPHDKTKKIILDANAIKENISLELVEEDYCYNGFLRKRMVLASPPYSPTTTP